MSPADLSLCAELLADLLRANLPLPEALRTLGKEAHKRALREALSQVGAEVAAGASFSEALRRRNGVFPDLFVRVVEQGLAANDLPAALVEVVREYRSQARFREALWSQLIGPITSSFFFAAFIILLLLCNVPEMFRGVFKIMGGTLPLPTRLLLAISGFVGSQAFWASCVIVLGAAVLIKVNLSRLPALRRWLQLRLLAIPGVGPYLRALLVGRFCRLLGLLLKCRMPLDVALGLVRDSFTFLPMRDAVSTAASRVELGAAMAEALSGPGQELFPETLLLFVRGGQTHGNLAESLGRVADMYEERAGILGVRLRFLIYLLCALGVGMIVFCSLLAVYLPIFKMQEMMRKH
jgi:type II secretory pathway component PulF